MVVCHVMIARKVITTFVKMSKFAVHQKYGGACVGTLFTGLQIVTCRYLMCVCVCVRVRACVCVCVLCCAIRNPRCYYYYEKSFGEERMIM